MKTFGLGVKILIINTKTSQFLAIARNPEKKLYVPESWDIPGGRLKVGEEPIDALSRELEEEIGYQLPAVPILIDAASVINNDDRQIIRLTYALEDTNQTINITLGDEHSAETWLPLKPSNEFHPCLNKAILKYISFKNWYANESTL